MFIRAPSANLGDYGTHDLLDWFGVEYEHWKSLCHGTEQEDVGKGSQLTNRVLRTDGDLDAV